MLAGGIGRNAAWWQDWKDQCAVIVAGGPSAKNAGVEKSQGRMRCIVINESHRLCPWADILYSCESDWWIKRESEIKSFQGIRLAFNNREARALPPGIFTLTIPKKNSMWADDFLFDEPGVVGSGGNSGFQMINLAAQFGAKRIALVGFDMRISGGTHWHGNHPSPLRNPDDGRCEAWRRVLDDKAPQLKERGIDVVNCSPVSALKSFPKMTVEQMLERWGL